MNSVECFIKILKGEIDDNLVFEFLFETLKNLKDVKSIILKISCTNQKIPNLP